MFVTIKRNAIAWGLAILMCAFLASAGVIIGGKILDASAKNGITVVIDAGHGGIDGGVVGTFTKTKESDINLAVSKSLAHFLKKSGYNVVMTRTSYQGLYDPKADSLKLSDMRKRKEIIENAKPDLVVSIHQNSYPMESVKGAQVFYDKSSETSEKYATTIQTLMNDSLGNSRLAKSAEYYILQCSTYPSVLIECGFLSNKQEESKLINAKYQEKVAYSIYMSICAIFFENNT